MSKLLEGHPPSQCPDRESTAHPDPAGLGVAMALLLAASFIRCPSILIHGRMWAEELPIFLRVSQRHTFGYALGAQHFGYFSIWDNFFGAVAAHWVPLSLVALLFSWSAVAVFLLTGYFIFQAEFLRTRTAKLLGVLALVLTAPSFETWLNLINSEFYFGLCSAVVLLSNASRLRRQRYAVLLLSALSGPVTTLLAPLFFVRALLCRSRPQFIQATIVGLCGLAQIGVAISSALANRRVQATPAALGAIIVSKDFLLVFLTRYLANFNFWILKNNLATRQGSHGYWLMAAGYWLLALGGAGGFILLLRKQGTCFWVFCVAFWMILLQFTLGREAGPTMIDPGASERYAFGPNVLLVLSIIPVAAQTWSSLRRKWARLLLGLAFISGFYDFVMFPIGMAGFWKGEPWRQQVLRQEQDPSVVLQGFPVHWSLPEDEIPPS